MKFKILERECVWCFKNISLNNEARMWWCIKLIHPQIQFPYCKSLARKLLLSRFYSFSCQLKNNQLEALENITHFQETDLTFSYLMYVFRNVHSCLSLSWKTEQRRSSYISFFVSDGICLQSCCVYMEAWWSRWASELQNMLLMFNYPSNGWKRFSNNYINKKITWMTLSVNNNIGF